MPKITFMNFAKIFGKDLLYLDSASKLMQWSCCLLVEQATEPDKEINTKAKLKDTES